MLGRQKIKLIDQLPVDSGGHIVYAFEEYESYIDNLTAYVSQGVKLGHRVLVVERASVFNRVHQRLSSEFSEEELRRVYFEDNGTFYGIHHDFQSGQIVEHFGDVLSALPESEKTIRTWAHVTWRAQSEIEHKLEHFERVADDRVQGFKTISVCVYESGTISSRLLLGLMKSHDYFMTDKHFTESPLYSTVGQGSVFPSLALHSEIVSEVDLYKQKLDFVHVVSHEVRNPLTIIGAYSRMLQDSETGLSDEGVLKLKAIEQYVKVIDLELNHIMQTEQMLSTDLYMATERVRPLQVTEEVIRLMEAKAAVQNVELVTQLEIYPSTTIMASEVGLSLLLSNLLSNAVKFSSEGDEVVFSVNGVGNRVEFIIADCGIGMSNQQLRRVFRKYEKSKESSGQGIGLYMVKTLCDRFAGSIDVQSALGKGTTITVSFPVVDENTSASSCEH